MMLRLVLLVAFFSFSRNVAVDEEELWTENHHTEDIEDAQCPDGSCIKAEGVEQTFGYTRLPIDDEECNRVKNACIKLRKCQSHCTLHAFEGGEYAHVNPCRLVVPLCQGINVKKYNEMRQFKNNDPFMI